MCVCVLQSLCESGLTASDWVKVVAPVVGGKAGGSKVSAQATGSLLNKVQEAVKVAREFANSKIV